MDFGPLSIVSGYPALYHRVDKTAIIADLHLGFESEAQREGVYLPRLQLRKALELIRGLSEAVEPKKLVIDGDVKQCFSRLSSQEREELSRIFAEAKDRFERVELVRGNHDNYVNLIASRFDIPLVDELGLSGGVLVLHGHVEPKREPRAGELLVIGHEHPALRIPDELGGVVKIRSFLFVPLRTGAVAVVLPAAGYYQVGNVVTLIREHYLSPIIRKYGVLEEAVPVVVEPGEAPLEFPPLRSLFELVGP
ncbi:MAG: metallophosphoesterase [Fervidicoccaceae archaeon]